MLGNPTVNTKTIQLLCRYSIILFIPTLALDICGHGIRLPDQDAFATGRGEAFAATADNASAVYYNPAGLGQITGDDLRAGVYGLKIGWTYDAPKGGSYDTEKNLHAIPQLFYAYGFESVPLTLGLGLYSPFGLSNKWPEDTGFRTLATEASVSYYTVNPALAWRVLPNLSVAAGVTFNYVQLDFSRGLFWPTAALDKFRFKGENWDAGYNLGLLWQPIPKVSLGANFRSPTSFDLDGKTQFRNDAAFPIPGGPIIPAFPQQTESASARFPFPLNAVFAISYRPTPKWNLEFDADYTDWTTVGTVMIHQSSGFASLIPQDLALPLNWASSWYYEFGATRYFGNGWSLSAGYIYNENSVPDANYTPLVGDMDRHFFSVGTGFKGKHFGFDAAYQFGWGPTHTVQGSAPSVIGQSADGDYSYLSHAIFLTAGWKF